MIRFPAFAILFFLLVATNACQNKDAGTLPEPIKNKRAVVVGSDHYPGLGLEWELPHAEADALAIAKALRKQGFLVETRIGREAAKRAILDAIAQAVNGQPEEFVLFYAGHGEQLQGKTRRERVLLTPGCSPDEPATCLRESDLAEALGTFSATTETLVVLDTDFAGLGSETTWQTMAAGKDDQTIRVAPCIERSLFGLHIEEGLEGPADSDGDGTITTKELFAYVHNSVERDIQDHQDDQNPWFHDAGRGGLRFKVPADKGVRSACWDQPVGLVAPCGTFEAKIEKRTKRPEMVRVPAEEFTTGCSEDLDFRCRGTNRPVPSGELRRPPWVRNDVPGAESIVWPEQKTRIDYDFWIDTTEVTVEAYTRCVEKGSCPEPKGEGPCNWKVPGREQHPIDCVSWNDARNYCAFVGKRLPTSLEWEKAARGNDGRPYPWGSADPTCAHAVFDDRHTRPVCSRSPLGDSPYGACDMAGNVWEWVEDSYEKEYRLLRGGAYYFRSWYLRAWYSFNDTPDTALASDGFRCVRDIEK